MGKFATQRNFGWGKRINWGGKQALIDFYGRGHFSSRATHVAQWDQFCRWLKDTHNIRDACQITLPICEGYAKFLSIRVQNKDFEITYAQNLLVGVNVTLEAMTGNKLINIQSPSSWVGRRSTVRTDQPTGYEWEAINEIASYLIENGCPRARIVVLLCRCFGIRLREAVLSNLIHWIEQARQKNAINVRLGTKGGRGNHVDRWILVNDNGRRILSDAVAVIKSLGCSNNLLLAEENYDGFVNNGEINRARSHLHHFGINGFRDLRASWACQEYQNITGFPAPVFAPNILVDRDVDRNAREKLAHSLGHNRIEIVSQYVGARKK